MNENKDTLNFDQNVIDHDLFDTKREKVGYGNHLIEIMSDRQRTEREINHLNDKDIELPNEKTRLDEQFQNKKLKMDMLNQEKKDIEVQLVKTDLYIHSLYKKIEILKEQKLELKNKLEEIKDRLMEIEKLREEISAGYRFRLVQIDFKSIA